MLNKVLLIGRLTKDPELRYTPSGVAVTSLRLAVDRPYANKEGEKQTDFFDIVVWRKLAEVVAEHKRKGDQIFVEGVLTTRDYEKEGRKIYVTEVMAENIRFLSKAKGNVENPVLSEVGTEVYDEEVPF